MAADELFRPTLLVGVGGTGSRIAERIMTTAVDTDRSLASKIGILCFDTDINTLNELKHVEKRSRIQFSQPERVATLLERMWPHVNTWCYGRQDAQMSQAILGMSLIEGAGQIRMLTRLALHDAFASDNLMARIEDEVSRLGRFAEDDSYSGAIHVMVVGSLAGATGSGSFAQVSLAVQQAARNRNVSATVRGLLLLPDIYARSGVLPATQIENVLANGYASLKELNAYNVFASMPERGASFTFDYAPGLNIREGEMPFAAITFIDYENSTGGSMGRGIASYLDMAARAGYLMIFSPLGANYGSVTINDVRQRLDALRSGSHNMYSGIGVSALQYPIQSVRKYLSRQLVLENLRGDWTRLDDAFRAQRQRYDQQVADGANPGEPPDIKVSYVRDLKQLASEEPRIPFFRRIWEKLNPEVEDEQTHERKVRPLHITYADALLDYSRKTFWADSEVADAKNRNSIDGSALTEASSILEVVQRCEAMLKTDFRRMEATLEGRPVDIYQNATISADDLAENQYAAHHFQAYMIKDGPHPVQVRAFLYMLRGELVDRLGQLDSADVRLKLFRLANVFRPDDEIQSTRNQPSQRDTPQVFEKAQEADGGGGVLGIFGGGKKKQFVSDYVGYYNASLQKMREYANTLVAEKVLNAALADVDDLIRTFTGLFAEIGEIAKDLARDAEVERLAHDGKGGADGNAFIYASADAKDDAWRRLKDAAAAVPIGDDVNKSLVTAVYRKYREDKRQRREGGFKEVRELFFEKVVVGFGERTVERDYQSVYDFSVMEALRRQLEVEDDTARRRGEPVGGEDSYPSRMRVLVDRVTRQSEPFLSFSNPNADGTGLKFWTVHPQVKRDLNNDALFDEMFIVRQGDNPIVKEEFSPYELICVNLRVNVELRHLQKLGHAPANARQTVYDGMEGRMSAAYQNMIDDILAAERHGDKPGFTPHVDRAWHVPGSLPEIFAEREGQIAGDAARGYVIALMNGLLIREKDEGGDGPQVRFSTRGRGMKGAVEKIVCPSHDPWTVYTAFTKNVPLVHAAGDFWTETLKRPHGSVEGNPVWKTLGAPDNAREFLRIVVDRSSEERDRDRAASSGIAAWFGLIEDLIGAEDTLLGPTPRRRQAERRAQALRGDVMDLVRDEGYPPAAVRYFESALDAAYDQYFAE